MKQLNIYELMSAFWEMHDLRHFTTSERELFFFLLKEGNRHFWKMPFPCSTGNVCSSLDISRSTLTRARRALKRRGVISYSEGARKTCAPTYTILPLQVADREHYRPTGETALETSRATSDETKGETSRATIIKDKEDSKTISSSPRTGKQSIDLLEKTLMADAEWQDVVVKQLSANGLSLPGGKTIADYIPQFFGYLRMCGVTEKEETDCRSHFFNKLKKEYIKSSINGNNQQEKYNRRRGTEVSPASATDYERAF